jgi:hypothetical protein
METTEIFDWEISINTIPCWVISDEVRLRLSKEYFIPDGIRNASSG